MGPLVRHNVDDLTAELFLYFFTGHDLGAWLPGDKVTVLCMWYISAGLQSISIHCEITLHLHRPHALKKTTWDIQMGNELSDIDACSALKLFVAEFTKTVDYFSDTVVGQVSKYGGGRLHTGTGQDSAGNTDHCAVLEREWMARQRVIKIIRIYIH